jgi:ACS family glucarate transporter-like MFS transporter
VTNGDERMKHRHVVMTLLCLLAVILYVDRVCISVALPRIQDDLHIAPEHLGWISVAFSIAYAVFEIPSGHMGDRTGPRRVLTRIVVWWSAFTALTGAATGLSFLLVTRFCFGAGEAGAWPNASTAVSRWFPIRARASAMGAFGAATQVGGALSPLVVIPIQQRFGWRASFFVFALFGLAWSVVWYAWFRDSPALKRGVLQAEIDETAGAPAPPAHGLPWSVASRCKSMWALMASWFAGVYCAYFGVFWLPTFLVKGRGFSEDQLRWVAVVWIAGMIGNAGGGFVSDALAARLRLARGRRLAAFLGMGLGSVAYASAALTHDKTATVALMAVVFASWGLFQANGFAVCIDIGRSHAGTVSAAMNTAGQLGGALSAVAFGYLVKSTGSYDAPLFVMAGVALLGILPWFAIDASRAIDANVVSPSTRVNFPFRPRERP